MPILGHLRPVKYSKGERGKVSWEGRNGRVSLPYPAVRNVRKRAGLRVKKSRMGRVTSTKIFSADEESHHQPGKLRGR